MNKKLLILLFLILVPLSIFSQYVPQPISNIGIYEFLDELSANQIIDLNSAIKPYSRQFIAKRLEEANIRRDQLGLRAKKDLDFYLKDFGKELNFDPDWVKRKDFFYYKDDLFTITVNPIIGGELLHNKDGIASYWRNGAEAWSYLGKWSFYGSLRDNHEEPLLGRPEYLSDREGGHIKGGTDWSEMRGGVAFAWDWGSVGLVKDELEWGSNYNGANIFGGNNPTFMQFKLHINPVKWFDFNYFHGSLTSRVVDSTRSYFITTSYGTDYRKVYHKKYVAANMFSFQPFERLWLSIGNSIIYSDYDLNPMYLIPIMFYKSLDENYSSGIDDMNSQMFFDISSRQIKYLHLYATVFIDELSVSRIMESDVFNYYSYKAGGKLTDFPVKNLSFTTEVTYTYPNTFQHFVPTLTFENNGFNMGHYLRDNSREWYFELAWRPVTAGSLKFWFSDAVRGPDYTALGGDRLGNPLIETVEWRNTTIGIVATWQPVNDLCLTTSFIHSDITGNPDWTAPFFYGITNTLSAGVTFGF